MNNLLRFDPEPFDFEGSPGASMPAADFPKYESEQEDELESRRGGSRSAGRSLSRSPAAPMRARSLRKGTASTGTARPSANNTISNLARSNRSAHGTNPWPAGPRWRRGSRFRGVWPYYYVGTGVDVGLGPVDGAPEHVRWVQTCLNSFLGLRLPLDGIMTLQTRAAIRTFQERRGLPINGLMGPETESALRDACAAAGAPLPASPGVDEGSRPDQPPPPGQPDQSVQPTGEIGAWGRSDAETGPAPSGGSLTENIERIARQELARWNNGTIKETDPKNLEVLRDYWKTGAGVNYTTSQLASPAFHGEHPWSAAFISWVMRKAGAGNDFKYSASHSVYTSAARANRLGNKSNPFKAYRISEVTPRVGDLVCKSRAGSGATYDTIRPGMMTHCDIVTRAGPDGLEVVGGNVSNSVSRGRVRVDRAGHIVDPNYFAVIHIDAEQPSVPQTPDTPAPGPGASAPKLLKRETVPPGTTLYLEIDLKIRDKFGITAPPMTGVFIPDGYTPGSAVDIVLYLHGHKAGEIRKQGVDQYWNSKRFPYGALREHLNTSGRGTVLVAPSLGSRSEAGRLLEPSGLDAFIAAVLAGLRANGAGGKSLRLGNLVLACHSGGGVPMRKLGGGGGSAIMKLRECWGFDCTYNGGDDTFWAGWARKKPDGKCYFYYIRGSQTARLAESLRDMRVANAVVLLSKDTRHNYVPITYLAERLRGADFMKARSGGGGPAPAGEPADLKSLTRQEFIEFVGRLAREAMTTTGVPASVTVAQAILETGWGKHTIGEARNLFGIKGRDRRAQFGFRRANSSMGNGSL